MSFCLSHRTSISSADCEVATVQTQPAPCSFTTAGRVGVRVWRGRQGTYHCGVTGTYLCDAMGIYHCGAMGTYHCGVMGTYHCGVVGTYLCGAMQTIFQVLHLGPQLLQLSILHTDHDLNKVENTHIHVTPNLHKHTLSRPSC